MKTKILTTSIPLISKMTGFAQTNKITIILIHGAWHGAWCWYKVAPDLQAKGFHVIAIDFPSHGKDTTNLR